MRQLSLKYGQLYEAKVGIKDKTVKYFGMLKEGSPSQRTHVILTIEEGKVVAYKFENDNFQFQDGRLEIGLKDKEPAERCDLGENEIEYLVDLAYRKGRKLSQLIGGDFRFNLKQAA